MTSTIAADPDLVRGLPSRPSRAVGMCGTRSQRIRTLNLNHRVTCNANEMCRGRQAIRAATRSAHFAGNS
jgi:hypothetical protein